MPTVYELETLVTKLTADVRELRSRLKEGERLLQNTARVADISSKNVSASLGGIGKTAIGVSASLLGLSSIMEAGFRSVKLAAGAETMSTTFRVLIGDADNAMKTLKELEQFAITTPFELPELIESAKQMIAFGEEADKIVPTMRRLGDVSAGLGIPLKDLTYLYGTLKSQGRAFTVDIRQFAMRGIPIYLELAKVLGLIDKQAKRVTPEVRQALEKVIEGGNVNFDVVEAAFKNMTKAGGQFFNLMDERAKTLEGVFNEMKESIDLSLREIGNTLIKGLRLNELIREVTKVTEKVNEFLKGMSTETRKAILIGTGLIAVFIGLSAAISVAGTLFTLFTGGLNIYAGLITVALGATIAWVYHIGSLERAWKVVKRAASDFWAFIKPVLPAIASGLLLLSGPLAPLYAGILLLVAYWKEVKAAFFDFVRFVEPLLKPLWSLIKSIAFTLRDEVAGAVRILERQFEKLAFAAGVIWIALGGGANVTWKQVQHVLRNIILFADFAWNNFSLFVELAMYKARGYLIYFEQSIIHFFTKQIPVVFSYFMDRWQGLWISAFNIAKSFMASLGKIIADGVANLPDIIAGKFDFNDLLNKEFEKFNKTLKENTGKLPPLELPDRSVSNAEKNVQKEVDRLNAVIERGFGQFKAKKELQFQFEDAAEVFTEVWENIVTPFLFPKQAVEVLATDAASTFNNIFKNEFKKVDAVLSNSAEALSRIAEYRTNQPKNIVRKTDIQQMAIAQQPPTQPNQAELSTVNFLGQILEEMRKLNARPRLEIVPAEIP